MIRVAILGAGIGREHLAALRQLPDQFQVAMVVDQDAARIEEIREGDSFAAVDKIATALADPNIDVIDVCLPPHLHVETTIAALNAGKHVVCEKPLATSLADVERIKTAAISNTRHVFPVFQYRWGPSLSQLRHLMANGLTGQPQVAALEIHWSRGADYYAAPWRGTWAGERGGAVLGHAIHNHDLLTHIMGPVSKVSAMVATRVNPIETEDCAAITFEMENGALCTSNITLGAAGDQTRLRFVFEHLTATSGDAPYAPGADPWTFVSRNPNDQIAINSALAEVPDQPIGFVGFFAEMAKAIAGLPSDTIHFADGARSVELVTAIYHSARGGGRVELPITPDHPLFEGWLP